MPPEVPPEQLYLLDQFRRYSVITRINSSSTDHAEQTNSICIFQERTWDDFAKPYSEDYAHLWNKLRERKETAVEYWTEYFEHYSNMDAYDRCKTQKRNHP